LSNNCYPLHEFNTTNILYNWAKTLEPLKTLALFKYINNI